MWFYESYTSRAIKTTPIYSPEGTLISFAPTLMRPFRPFGSFGVGWAGAGQRCWAVLPAAGRQLFKVRSQSTTNKCLRDPNNVSK